MDIVILIILFIALCVIIQNNKNVEMFHENTIDMRHRIKRINGKKYLLRSNYWHPFITMRQPEDLLNFHKRGVVNPHDPINDHVTDFQKPIRRCRYYHKLLRPNYP
jgi:hypothetical protein